LNYLFEINTAIITFSPFLKMTSLDEDISDLSLKDEYTYYRVGLLEFSDMTIYFEDSKIACHTHSQYMVTFSEYIKTIVISEKKALYKITIPKGSFAGINAYHMTGFLNLAYPGKYYTINKLADFEIIFSLCDYFNSSYGSDRVIENFKNLNIDANTNLSIENIIKTIIICQKYKICDSGEIWYTYLLTNIFNYKNTNELYGVFEKYIPMKTLVYFTINLLKCQNIVSKIKKLNIQKDGIKPGTRNVELRNTLDNLIGQLNSLEKKYLDTLPKYSDFKIFSH
jgi:hypothetical protein